MRTLAQTRQWSGIGTKTNSVNGVANMFLDVAILSYDAMVATAVSLTATGKQIAFLGMSWQDDLQVTLATNVVNTGSALNGAMGIYVASYTLTGGSVPRLGGTAGQPFLTLNEIGAGATVDQLPKRILYRRRFTMILSNTTGSSVAGGAYLSPANVTPGYGTDRTIRKRAKLGRQEGLFARWELYNISTSAASNITIQADFLGAVSYAFL